MGHFGFLCPSLRFGKLRPSQLMRGSVRAAMLLVTMTLAHSVALHAGTEEGGAVAEARTIERAQPLEGRRLAAESAMPRPGLTPTAAVDDGQVQLTFAAIGLMTVPLLLSLAISAFRFVASVLVPAPAALALPLLRQPPVLSVPPELVHSIDDEQECREILRSAVDLWQAAETAILLLEEDQPLRALMERELQIIGRGLGMYPELNSINKGALTVVYPRHYWRMLHRELSRACRELTRICSVAKAGGESLGSRSALPQVPKTVIDAYFVLGVNSEVNEDTLKRLVRSLRQCWHPDIAQTTIDRDYREARIRQINVAFELIAKGAAA